MVTNNYKQQVINFFNRRTAYDQEGERHLVEANLLLNSVPLSQGQKILDIATGTGLVAIPAAQKIGPNGYAIAVDFSPGMLNQAREKIAALGLNNIELIESDAELIDFEDSTFDVIYCCSAITYMPDIPATLKKWNRFLKPGGYLAFTCPDEAAYFALVQMRVCEQLFDIKLPHINEPLNTPQKCHTLLREAGFRDIQLKIESRGNYVNLEKISLDISTCFYPRGNPLSQLSPDQLQKLQAKYLKEVETLVTDKGIWLDTTTFFIVARS